MLFKLVVSYLKYYNNSYLGNILLQAAINIQIFEEFRNNKIKIKKTSRLFNEMNSVKKHV